MNQSKPQSALYFTRRSIIAFSLILLSVSICRPTMASPQTEQKTHLLFPIETYFHFVLREKKLIENGTIPFPQVLFSSETNLAQFQNALKDQWGFIPDQITNAYSIKTNEIYLLDDAHYYEMQNTCMDDSLVHELTHYIQSRYQKFDLNDEMLELEAIEIQQKFRSQFCHP